MTEVISNQKKLTIPEFKAWLDGLSDIQPEDWAPDLNQWKKIKLKIQSLEDFETQLERQIIVTIENALNKVTMPVHPLPAWQSNHVHTSPVLRQYVNEPEVSHQPPPYLVPPIGVSSLAETQVITPNMPATISNLDPRNAIPIESVKTPHIDTATGPYKSSFL